MDSLKLSRENLLKKIAGEIVLSENPGKTMQKWRTIFKISQKELAKKLGISPSVISDYESGRRKSPGIKMIKKFVECMIEIDEERGGEIIKSFSIYPSDVFLSDILLDIKEFSIPIELEEFCKAISSKLVVKPSHPVKIYGYAVIDSFKAVLELPPGEMVKFYGIASHKALIFTKIKRGRSPMIALKVSNLKPPLVVYHGEIEKLDELAIRIAEVEKIPLAIITDITLESFVKRLSSIGN